MTYRKIHNSAYGADSDNYHLSQHEAELHVSLTYPNMSDASFKYVVFDQESVRASLGIRISFDYARNGYLIERPTVTSWEVSDKVCDPCWVEVALIDNVFPEDSE